MRGSVRTFVSILLILTVSLSAQSQGLNDLSQLESQAGIDSSSFVESTTPTANSDRMQYLRIPASHRLSDECKSTACCVAGIIPMALVISGGLMWALCNGPEDECDSVGEAGEVMLWTGTALVGLQVVGIVAIAAMMSDR